MQLDANWEQSNGANDDDMSAGDSSDESSSDADDDGNATDAILTGATMINNYDEEYAAIHTEALNVAPGENNSVLSLYKDAHAEALDSLPAMEAVRSLMPRTICV